jgi:L-serine dehydratase
MAEKNVSIFDIFGPIMIGPSSSHTAGIARIAYLARKIFPYPVDRARVSFYGSLAWTYRGHGSDKAAVAGLLGIMPEDERLNHSFEIAAESGFTYEIVPVYELPERYHVNTVIIELENAERRIVLRGASIGGGSILIQEINGFEVDLSGELSALLVSHHDEVGVIAIVSHILAANRINIAGTSSHRKEKGDEALLVVEVDSPVGKSIVQQIESLPPIYSVVYIPGLSN